MMCPTSGRLGSPAADVTQRAHATARDTSRSMLPLYLFPVWTVSSATQPAPLISVKVLYTIARSEQPMSRIVETDRDGHDLQERSFPYNQRCADLPALRVQYEIGRASCRERV